MSSDWLSAVPAVIAAGSVLFFPGALLLGVIRIRGLALVALAPAASVAQIAVLAIVYGLVGVPWGLVSVVLGIAVFVAVGFGLRLVLTEPPAGNTRSVSTTLLLGIVVGAAFTVWRLASYIQAPDAISQTNDAVFHLNALRFILESETASSLQITSFLGASGFYPAGWHGVTSLVALLVGGEIALATNAVTIAISACVWVPGIAWLARVVFRSNGVATLAAVLASALQTFPLLMFQWGVLYPNGLATSLLPAAVALALVLGDYMKGAVGWNRGWPAWALASLVLAVTAIGVALAQPAGLLPVGLIILVWLTVQAFLKTVPIRYAVMLVGLWILLAIVWWVFARSTSGSHWPPFRGKIAVFADVFFNGQLGIPFAFGVSAMMFLGFIGIARHRSLWWVGVAWLAIAALYVLVAAVGAPFVRDVVLGPWYADPNRLAALAPVLVIPIAAYGTYLILERVRNAVPSWRDSGPAKSILLLAAGAAFMLALVVVRPVALPNFGSGTFESTSRYTIDHKSYLSTDERTLLESLPTYVPPDARILVNPSAGGAFGYVLTGLDVFPRNWNPSRTSAWSVLADGLRNAGSDAAVCDALEAYASPKYVLDFGPGSQGGGKYVMEGMTSFEGQPGFEFVAREGDASLWRITACTP